MLETQGALEVKTISSTLVYKHSWQYCSCQETDACH